MSPIARLLRLAIATPVNCSWNCTIPQLAPILLPLIYLNGLPIALVFSKTRLPIQVSCAAIWINRVKDQSKPITKPERVHRLNNDAVFTTSSLTACWNYVRLRLIQHLTRQRTNLLTTPQQMSSRKAWNRWFRSISWFSSVYRLLQERTNLVSVSQSFIRSISEGAQLWKVFQKLLVPICGSAI